MLRDPWLKALVVLLVVIASFYLAGLLWTLILQIADIILMLVLAWLVSFALEPITQIVLSNNRKIARPLAVASVYLGLLVVLSSATLLLVPIVVAQVTQIGNNLPAYVDSGGAWLTSVQESLPRQGAVAAAIASIDYAQLAKSVETMGPTIVNNAVSLATGLASLLFNLVLVMMFSFYIMLDGGKFTSTLVQALPSDRRDEANYLIFSIHRSFGGFIRGQLIQAVIYGCGTALVMTVADLSYTVVVAMFAAVIMMVPFIGPILAIVPPIVIAILVHPESTWWVLLVLLGLQQIVLNVLAPRVMGQTVGIHPLIVLLALLVGAKLAGIWGAIFAVPVAGTLVAMIAFSRMSVEEKAAETTRAVGTKMNGTNGRGPDDLGLDA